MIDHVDASDLPPRLQRLVQVIGLPQTLRLVEARGGTRIYVPMLFETTHWLANFLDPAALKALIDAYRGEIIELDRAARALRAVRDRRLIAAHDEGVSTATLALEFGLTQRQVFYILARVDDHAGQLDIFQHASS